MTDVLSGSIGIELEDQRGRALRQRAPGGFRRGARSGGESAYSRAGKTRPIRAGSFIAEHDRELAGRGRVSAPRDESSPAFVREPEGNGVVARLFKTLKEQTARAVYFHWLPELCEARRLPGPPQPRVARRASRSSGSEPGTTSPCPQIGRLTMVAVLRVGVPSNSRAVQEWVLVQCTFFVVMIHTVAGPVPPALLSD